MKDTLTQIKTFKGIVVFVLGEKDYCLNVANVSAIIKPEELEKYCEAFIRKISVLKNYNKDFSLVDVKSVFGVESGNLTTESRIILIDCDFVFIGLYVEKVKEIITLELKNGVNRLEFNPFEGNLFIKGTINYENRAMLFPNLEELCSRSIEKKANS